QAPVASHASAFVHGLPSEQARPTSGGCWQTPSSSQTSFVQKLPSSPQVTPGVTVATQVPVPSQVARVHGFESAAHDAPSGRGVYGQALLTPSHRSTVQELKSVRQLIPAGLSRQRRQHCSVTG